MCCAAQLEFPSAKERFDSMENFVFRNDMATVDEVCTAPTSTSITDSSRQLQRIKQHKKSMEPTAVYTKGKIVPSASSSGPPPFYSTFGGAVSSGAARVVFFSPVRYRYQSESRLIC